MEHLDLASSTQDLLYEVDKCLTGIISATKPDQEMTTEMETAPGLQRVTVPSENPEPSEQKPLKDQAKRHGSVESESRVLYCHETLDMSTIKKLHSQVKQALGEYRDLGQKKRQVRKGKEMATTKVKCEKGDPDTVTESEPKKQG